MKAAIRRAISTPRDGIPASTTLSSSGFRSMISCAIRRSARRIASASMIGTAAQMDSVLVVSRFPWRPRRIALKEQKIRRRPFRCAPPFVVALASWSDVSRSNRAAPFQSRCLSRLFRSRSTCVSKFLRAPRGTPCKAPILNELRLICFRRGHLRLFFHKISSSQLRTALPSTISNTGIRRVNRRIYLDSPFAGERRGCLTTGSILRRFSAIRLNSAVTGDFGSSPTIGIPRSPASRVAMSIGIWPSNGTRSRFASRSPPPCRKYRNACRPMARRNNSCSRPGRAPARSPFQTWSRPCARRSTRLPAAS